MQFDVVVATDLERGIGKDGDLPWYLPGDLKFFKDITSTTASPDARNAVIMGRKTWESIPSKWRPLSDRLNVVISRDESYPLPEGVLRAHSLDQALVELEKQPIERCFVIGGGQIYESAIRHPGCRLLYITEVKSSFGCDTFFPPYDRGFALLSSSELHEESGIEYCFKTYSRV